jgi:hypothetical protein
MRQSFFILAALAMLSAPAAAEPATQFDGIWVLDATVTGGLCPARKKQLYFALQNAQIVKLLGIPNPQYAGKIEADGQALFLVKTLGATAQVVGKLGPTDGAGAWASNSVLCPKGDWRAHKAQ